MSQAGLAVAPGPLQVRGMRRPVRLAAVAALALAAVIGMQCLAGAYTAEFGGAADEAAHYVTGLMVREYLTSGFSETPMRFATRYYQAYPQVSFGHWPPFFYIVQAVWTLAAPPSRISALLLIALISTALTVLLFHVAETLSGTVAAVLTSALFLLLPLRQALSSMVMAETLITLLALCAMLAWARFFQTGAMRDALGFAAALTLAIMTKGNAWALVLVPGITILAGRRFDLLRSRAMWAAAAVVAGVCLPWHLLTMRLVQNGWEYQPGLAFFTSALAFNTRALLQILGPGLAAMAALGMAVVLPRAGIGKTRALWQTAAGAFLAILLFQCLVPASLDRRHLLMAIPFALLFVPAGVSAVAAVIPGSVSRRFTTGAVVAVLAASFLYHPFQLYRKPHHGLSEAAGQLLAGDPTRESVYLVSSEKYGEGVFVAELAMRNPTPGPPILRASKVLSVSSWSGAGYRCLFDSDEAVEAYLERTPIDIVVLDLTPSNRSYQHHAQLRRAIEGHANSWRQVGSFGPDERHGGEVVAYRLIRSIPASAPLRNNPSQIPLN